MKIENEYVNIKCGNKTFNKHNFFLNNYLKLFSKSQIDYSYKLDVYKLLTTCYLKLDTPLDNVTYDSELNSQDFDYTMFGLQHLLNTTNKTISLTYRYNNSDDVDRENLIGHKIMAIAFGGASEIYTYLDTSEYDLEITDGLINIARKDNFSTDAICSYDYPYHLCPIKEDYEYESGGILNETKKYSILYSVGLGKSAGNMEEEYIIGENAIIYEEDDFTYNFVLKKATDSGVYPLSNNIFPSIDLQPKTFKIKTSKYPSNNIYAGSNLYPSVGDYKYIIMKYRFYYIDIETEQPTFINEYYTMSFYTDKAGVLTIKDKIERND